MNQKLWSRVFLVAAIWNAVIAAGILAFPEWSYKLVYVATDVPAPVRRLWWDFGLSVLIVGFGYYLVSRDVTKNHGIVLIGLLGKLLVDVVGLTYRYLDGAARAFALAPAGGDAVFVVLFGIFAVRASRERRGTM